MESTPSAPAASHKADSTAGLTRTCGSKSRAAAISLALHGTASQSCPEPTEGLNASRSISAAQGRSSSSMPSSRATTPRRADRCVAMPSRSSRTNPLSITAASRAAVPASTRSAMASSTTPPSAWASTPWRATGRPACSVAPRSSPPSKAVSSMRKGTRRHGVPCGRRPRSRASQPSRAGPAGARRITPPKPTGSMANNAADRAASAASWLAWPGSGGSPAFDMRP